MVLTVASMSAWGASGATHALGQEHSATRLSTAGTYLVRGVDQAGGRLYVEDLANGRLLQSDDWGATFSDDLGLPEGVRSVGKLVMFKSNLYMIGRDLRSDRVGVYRAAPITSNGPPGVVPSPVESLEWSPPLLQLDPGATALGTNLNADSRFLYVGEYGDPKPGPRLYRSADGVRWQSVFGPARRNRHIHGVAADPFRPGHVWMTLGDSGKSIYRSKRHGARGSWRVVVPSAAWQSVQISFDRSWVYLAADTHSETFFVIDRKTERPRLGTPQYYARKHPPGAPATARYLPNAFFGAVDPSTGVYYCVANDDSESSMTSGEDWQGFFAVRRVGGPIEIVDPGGEGISMNGEVFVGGGRIWSGQWSLPAIQR